MTAADISVCLRKALISAYPLNFAKSDESTASYVSINRRDKVEHSSQFCSFKRLPRLLFTDNK